MTGCLVNILQGCSQFNDMLVLAGLTESAIEGLEHGYDTMCTPEIFSQVSIARAVAAQPSLLLLNEITANLDADTEKTVLQALKRAAQSRTAISVSHRTSAEMGKIIAL